MKIKLVLLDSDRHYLNRLVTVFNDKYANELEVYAFTDSAHALEAIGTNKIPLILADENSSLSPKELPSGCTLAYLTGDSTVKTIQGQPAICKFQWVESLYRQLIDVMADSADPQYVYHGTGSTTPVVLFASPCGGVGTSASAAATAIHAAQAGKKVLYLNLESFGGADTYFTANGKDFSDIIYALKSKKNNLLLKLESCLNKDAATDVYFYRQPKIALDMLELTGEEKKQLLQELSSSGMFEKIVVDAAFSLQADFLSLARYAEKWVWCCDGFPSANRKITDAYRALTVLEENADHPLGDQCVMLGCKWTAKSVALSENAPKMVGTSAFIAESSACALVQTLAGLPIFGTL